MAVRGAGGQAEASIVDVGKAFATIMLVHDPVISRYDDKVWWYRSRHFLLDADRPERCEAGHWRERSPSDAGYSEESAGRMSEKEGWE